jgi:hypothetical protein
MMQIIKFGNLGKSPTMRTTLALDDDIVAAAKHLALRDKQTLGEVISRLARKGLARDESSPAKRNGVPLLPISQPGALVSLELVNQLRDEAA